MLVGVPIASSWLRGLAGELGRADGAETADAAADRWANRIAEDQRFTGLVYRAGLIANCAGQLMVRDVELHEEHGLATRDDDPAFLDLPFDDAIAFFERKGVMTPEEFAALEDRFKAAGFTASRLASQTLLERAKALIARSLAGDMTIDELVDELRAAADGDEDAAQDFGIGLSPASPSYFETVARTNVQVAYGAGRYTAMSDPGVIALRPYWQYLTARDSRVRASHRLLDGCVFEAGSDLGRYYYPPCGFNCRCNEVSLSARQFADRGLVLVTSRITGADPDEGFEGQPRPLAA